MKRYAPNSPQAIARILCMFMMGDGVMGAAVGQRDGLSWGQP